MSEPGRFIYDAGDITWTTPDLTNVVAMSFHDVAPTPRWKRALRRIRHPFRRRGTWVMQFTPDGTIRIED